MHEYKELPDYFEQPWRVKLILDIVHKTDGKAISISRRLPIGRPAVTKRLKGVYLTFPDEVLDIIADPELTIKDCRELLIIKARWVVPSPLIEEQRRLMNIAHVKNETRVLELQNKNPELTPKEIQEEYNKWRAEKGLPDATYAYVTNFLFKERTKE